MNDLMVGIDVAKAFHQMVVTVPDPQTRKAKTVLSRRVENTPTDIAGMITEIGELEAEHGAAEVGIDILGGIARVLEVMVADAGLILWQAVKTARRATRGGEHKSDPRDARVIADQIRARDDLRRVPPFGEAGCGAGAVSDPSPRVGHRTDPADHPVKGTYCAPSIPV